MGELINLAAYRRKKEIDQLVYSTFPDPVDEALDRAFVEHQRAQMRQQIGALHEVLSDLSKRAKSLREMIHGPTTS